MDTLIVNIRRETIVICYFNYISVGVDVGSKFSWVTILAPNHKKVVKPFKIYHSKIESLGKFVNTIKRAEEKYSMEAHCYLESSGIYHIPLFCYLKDSGLKAFVLNPLITDSNRNQGIRKVKSDKRDSIRIAKTGYTDDLKTSLIPSDTVLNMRSIVREYYSLIDCRTQYVNKLHKELSIVFPGYIGLFSNLIGKTSMAILREYKTPDAILAADKDSIIVFIANTSKRGIKYAQKKCKMLIDSATISKSFGHSLKASYDLIQMYLEFIQIYTNKTDQIITRIEEYIKVNEEECFVKQIKLIESINSIGLMSAVTLMCEIGDFSEFKKPKQLYAYFGLDPAVKESGTFKATRVKMSKRGSRIARRVLFMIALVSISKAKNGVPVNPVLRTYYEKKIESKPKKVAIVAIMHKLSNIIFAVLRDEKAFVLKTPQQHCKQHNKKKIVARIAA